jgi:hypothetical protein
LLAVVFWYLARRATLARPNSPHFNKDKVKVKKKEFADWLLERIATANRTGDVDLAGHGR